MPASGVSSAPGSTTTTPRVVKPSSDPLARCMILTSFDWSFVSSVLKKDKDLVIAVSSSSLGSGTTTPSPRPAPVLLAPTKFTSPTLSPTTNEGIYDCYYINLLQIS